jgi:hypothetical protein
MAHYNYFWVKQNCCLFFLDLLYHFIWYYHTLYPNTFIDLMGLGAILRHSANCFVNTDHSSSSLETYSRFIDEDCYHGFHANWTPIEWSWMIEMRWLTLQGTQKFRVTQRLWRMCNSQALGQLFYQDRSLIKFTKVVTNQWITHYYRIGGTGNIPRHSANCFIKTYHSASSLDTHSRFIDEDCNHGNVANWTLIELIWMTNLRLGRL